ncbi:hypothetical protein CYMTET_23116 [Cymbomonas tetramitiformis]|uniref:J domain-containing protein n=1 Tax=Cymbomonas tetramitiformis TaxID=36881 RepID=A0AAE0FZ43_9CHLO|nr:hypothetical protein CYMTET_23116 [Cymbomonas tetramitiformis]
MAPNAADPKIIQSVSHLDWHAASIYPCSAIRVQQNVEALQWIQEVKQSMRCSHCWCLAQEHETETQAKVRGELEAAADERARQKRARDAMEAQHRINRVQASRQRAENAEQEGIELRKTRQDMLRGAELGGCEGCSECPGFEVHYTEHHALDTKVMFYCSMCGCDAAKHTICSAWKAQEEKKRKALEHEQEARRKAWERHNHRQQQTARSQPKPAAALKTLGLHLGATTKQISAAYRKMALRWHPDKNPGADREHAQAKFVEVTEAFKSLRDE